MLKTDTYLH